MLYCFLNIEKKVIRMKRNALSDLLKWKESETRKPMVLKGARQVGKTWLMKEFGSHYYDKNAVVRSI